MGDLNADYMSTTRSTFVQAISIQDRWVQKGDIVSVPVYNQHKNTLAGLAMYLDSELDIVGVSTDIETITPMHGAHPAHGQVVALFATQADLCLLYTSPSPRD